MHPPVQLCLSIIVLYAVAADPLLPVLKRPECGRNLEANIMGTRYDVHSGSDDGDFRSNSLWDRANSVDVGNVVSSDDDFDNLMRALPNETFLTVVSWYELRDYGREFPFPALNMNALCTAGCHQIHWISDGSAQCYHQWRIHPGNAPNNQKPSTTGWKPEESAGAGDAWPERIVRWMGADGQGTRTR